MTDLAILQAKTGIIFKNPSLLEQSLVHRSYRNENPHFHLDSNERLEFLGDAFIGYIVGEYFYNQLPDLTEGELTKLRSAVVCGESLASVAANLELGDFLYMGRGEVAGGGRKRQRTLASALEALVGAVLLDRGHDAARKFTLRILSENMENAKANLHILDYKSRLQEIVQAKQQISPTYLTKETYGPDHKKTFTVEVLVNGVAVGIGVGKSKQLAEKEAAKMAIKNLLPEDYSV